MEGRWKDNLHREIVAIHFIFLLPICQCWSLKMSVNQGCFFSNDKRLFRVLSILKLSKPFLYFLAYNCSFFTPLISENKLYKIGVFNLCYDSNKITVFNKSAILVEAPAAHTPKNRPFSSSLVPLFQSESKCENDNLVLSTELIT